MADDETYREIVKISERVQKELTPGHFWVVTNPTEHSTHKDIVFKTDLKGLILQAGGGLREKDIFGLYDNKTIADRKGYKLLDIKGRYGCSVNEVYDPKKGRCIKK